MKLKLMFLVLVAALLLSSNLAFGQELSSAGPKKPRTAADYQPRTMKELAAMSAVEIQDDVSAEVLTGNLLPSRVRVTYQSSQRRLSAPSRDVILHWAQRYAGDPRHYTGPYTTELLFRDAGLNHWLVVNKNLLPRFKREFRKGRRIDLNVIRLGAFKTEGEWTWVLLVESIAEIRKTH